MVADADRTIRVVDGEDLVGLVDRSAVMAALVEEALRWRSRRLDRGSRSPRPTLPLAPVQTPSPWPRRLAWAVVAVVVVVIGLVWLRPGFPERWVVDVTAWFDAFRDWAIQNRTTSPLFTYFLTPIENTVEALVDATVTALERLTWLGLVVGAARARRCARRLEDGAAHRAGRAVVRPAGRVGRSDRNARAGTRVGLDRARDRGAGGHLGGPAPERVERVLRPSSTRCRRSPPTPTCSLRCCCSASGTRLR